MADDSDPDDVVSAWERHSRTFATAAIAFFAIAVLLAGRTHPGPLPIVSLIACAGSVVIVIKARVTVHRAKRDQLQKPADLPVE